MTTSANLAAAGGVALAAAGLVASAAFAQTRPSRGPEEEGGKVTVSAGYMQGAGNVTAAIGYFDDRYDEFWVGEEKMALPPGLEEIRTKGLVANVNVGATQDLDLYANVPYTHAEATSPDAPAPQAGLGDVEIGAKYRFATLGDASRHDLIATLGVRFPASDYLGDRPVAIGHDNTGVAPGVILFSRWAEHYFTTVTGAYDFQNGDPPNDFRYSLQGGVDGDRYAAAVRYEQQISADGTDIGEGPFTTNQQDIKRLGFNVYGEIRQGIGVSADARFVLDGTNIGKAKGFSLAMVIRAPND